jgi:hypothetical protein
MNKEALADIAIALAIGILLAMLSLEYFDVLFY